MEERRDPGIPSSSDLQHQFFPLWFPYGSKSQPKPKS